MNDAVYKSRWLAPGAFAVCLIVFAIATSPADATEASAKITFVEHIAPIFRDHCGSCHNPNDKKGDLDLSTMTGLLAGSSTGNVVAAGDPADSTLYLVMNHDEQPHMPPKKPKLSDDQITMIRKWIEGGMLENDGSKAVAAKPKVSIAIAQPVMGKPQGPPPMPAAPLLEEPVVTTERPGAILAMDHSPWAPLLAIAGQHQIVLYHTQSHEMLGVLPIPEGFARVVRFSRNGRYLLGAGGYGAKRGLAILWDITTGKRITTVGDEYDMILAADISADQSLVAVGGPDKLVKAYATATGERAYEIKKHTDWVTALSFSPDGILLATGDRNGGLYVWEGATGEPFYTLRGHKDAITAIAFRGDANVMASASEDGSIRLWNMHNGQQIRSINAHGGGALDVRFTHDGRLVSAGRDRLVKVWDDNGRMIKQSQGFNDLALSATFTHDGKHVVGGSFDGEVRLVNVDDGKTVTNYAANPPDLDTRIAEIDRAIAEISKTIATIAKDDAAQKAVRENVGVAQKDHDDAVRRKGELESQHKADEGKVKPLDQRLKAAEREAQQADRQRDQAKRAFDNVPQPEVDAKPERIEQLSAKRRDAEAKFKQAEQAALAKRDEHEKLKAERAALDKSLADARAEIQRLDKSIPQLKQQAEAAAARAAQLDALLKQRDVRAQHRQRLEKARDFARSLGPAETAGR